MKVYFIYSSEQYILKKKIEEKAGRIYTPSKVLVNGKYKEFTMMTTDLSKISFSDYITITSGEKSQMKIKK